MEAREDAQKFLGQKLRTQYTEKQHTELDELSMIIGIVVGLVGMVPVALAYPIYDRVLKKQRKKIAPEILRLTDELLK